VLGLGLTLAGAACDKGGDGTAEPSGKDGGSKDTKGGGTVSVPLDGGKDYQYPAAGFVLTATMQIKFELSSSEGAGVAEVSAKSVIEATPHDGGKLKIHGKVLELLNYKGTGQLDPEFMKKQAEQQGQAGFDLVAELRKAESWSVIDTKGELDEAASKALPENKTEEEQGQDFGFFNLPDLPRVDLVQGEKVKLPTKEEQRQLPFGSVPVEIDETWTLRAINNNVAEFDVTREGSGATTISGGQGSASVSMLEESSFTVLYDLNTKLPVSFTGYTGTETSIDAEAQNFSFSTSSDISAQYQPGSAAPAPAPAAASGG
jgi:hypothetical protein